MRARVNRLTEVNNYRLWPIIDHGDTWVQRVRQSGSDLGNWRMPHRRGLLGHSDPRFGTASNNNHSSHDDHNSRSYYNHSATDDNGAHHLDHSRNDHQRAAGIDNDNRGSGAETRIARRTP